MRVSTLALFGALALTPAASAQYGTLIDRGFGLGASVQFPDEAIGFGVSAGLAAPRYDATIGFSRVTPEDSDIDVAANSFTLGGTAYLTRQSMSLPVTLGVGADLGYTALENDANIDISIFGINPYVGISHRAMLSPSLMLVPEARLGAVFLNARVEDESDSSTEFTAGLGVSFVFGTGTTRFAITPALGIVDDDVTPSIRLALLLPR